MEVESAILLPKCAGLPLFSDWVGIVGLIVSVFGFLFTIITLVRSKAIAEQTKKAAEDAISRLREVHVVADLSSVIAKIDEVKRLHRIKSWLQLPDRYSEITRLISHVRASDISLDDAAKTVLQKATTDLVKIEKEVEREIMKDTRNEGRLMQFSNILTLLANELNEITCRSRDHIGGGHGQR